MSNITLIPVETNCTGFVLLSSNSTTNQTPTCDVTADYAGYWQACYTTMTCGSILLFALGTIFHIYAVLYVLTEAKRLRECMVSFYMVALVISNQFKLLSELPFQFLLTDTNLKPAKFVVHLIVWARFSFAEISSWIIIKTLTQIPSWSPNYTLARLAIFTFIYLAFFVKNFILIIVDGDLAFYFDCSVLFARLEDCQVDNPEFLASYAWFYYCYQMSYCYVPIWWQLFLMGLSCTRCISSSISRCCFLVVHEWIR